MKQLASCDTPLLTDMSVISVAGCDSMLLNLSGAHGPYFTRKLVMLEDSSGHTGLGEVPGGKPIQSVLEQSQTLVVGSRLDDRERVLESILARFGEACRD